MKRIVLDKAHNGVVKADELVSPERFKLGLLAQQIAAEEAIDALLAQSSYEDKIRILEHQTKTALHVLNNFSHRALLADEVGLGKTIEAGIIIKEYITRKIAKKILILTPASLVYQWQEEMRSKFSEDFHVPKDPADYEEQDKLVVSIDTAKTEKHAAVIREIYWDLLIIDEAHKLKNKETLNYKFVKGISKERCLMLTATPLQNNVIELWNLLDLLHPGFLSTKQQFIESFLADDQGLKIKNNDALRQKLEKIMVRNLRKDTGIDWPKRFVETKILDYSPKEREFYTKVVQFIKKKYEAVKELKPPEEKEGLTKEDLEKMAEQYKQRGLLTFALIMLTRQITSSIKTGLAALQRYRDTVENEMDQKMIDVLINEGKLIDVDKKVDTLLKIAKQEKEHKIIIFTSFIQTQKTIELELQLAGFSTVLFNGKMNPQEKEEAIERFKRDKQVLICTDAGSEGRNLQFAHILINFDLPWNPMVIEQRIGRVHRIGQERDVQIINLAVSNTIEAYILNRLYEKINLFHAAIGEMDLILTQLGSKKGVEIDIFEAFMNDEDVEQIGTDMERAVKKVDDIKALDAEVFDKGAGQGGNDGSCTD